MDSLLKIKRDFNENGYVKIEKLFSKKDIGKIFSQISNIKKKSLKVKNPNMHFTSDKRLNTVHDIHKYVKSGPIISISKNKKMIKIVEGILGEKSILRNIEFFLKPKQTGMRAPLHQDNYYWNIKNKKALNVWIACTSSNIENGGLYYYKKSHKGGIKKHIMSFEPGSSQKIPENYIKGIKNKKYYPNLTLGDCLIHHCEIVHGSKKNKSNKDRIGLVISYKGKSAKIDKRKLKLYRLSVKKNIAALKNKIN